MSEPLATKGAPLSDIFWRCWSTRWCSVYAQHHYVLRDCHGDNA